MAEQFRFHLLNKSYVVVVSVQNTCVNPINRGKLCTNVKQTEVTSFCKNYKLFEFLVTLQSCFNKAGVNATDFKIDVTQRN